MMPEKILVVEDEPDVLKILTALLKFDNYTVETALDGREALNKVKAFNPDLILLDEMLPLIRGNEVARTIKADINLRKIPIIMLTARYLQRDKFESLLEAGVDDYMTKPFEPDELKARIKAMLRIKKLTDELDMAGQKLAGLYDQMSDIAAIRKSMLDEVMEGMPYAVILMDSDHKIVEANSNTFDMVSVSQEEIIGKTVEQVFGVFGNFDQGKIAVHKEYSDQIKGRMYLDFHCFKLAGRGMYILLLTDATRDRMLKNIQALLEKATRDGIKNQDFFKYILDELKSYMYAEVGGIYIFDEDRVYKGDIGAEVDTAAKDVAINIRSLKMAGPATVMATGADIGKYVTDANGVIKNILLIPLKGTNKRIGEIVLYNCAGIEKSFGYKIDVINFIMGIIGILYENFILIAKLNRENILVRSLINISQIINSTLDYQKLIVVFVEIVSHFMGTDTVALFLFDRKDSVLELVHSTGFDPKDTDEYKLNPVLRSEVEGTDKPQNSGIALEACEKFKIFSKSADKHIFPMKLRYKLIGYIVVKKAEQDQLRLEMLSLLTEHVAKAIENSYLFSQVVKQNEQLIATAEVLRKTEQKLIISEQLAGMGRFAAAVAHEIRNPLTIMLGAVQNAKNATAEEKGHILESLEARIIDIDHILRQMMEFAKQINISIEDFEPEKSILSTLEFISRKAKVDKVEITKEINLKSKMRADKMWLERVLLNLYINAIDEMKAKGGGILSVWAGEDEDDIIIKITDTGTGIPLEIRGRIFEPFMTTKKAGTGLGLYNVKKTLELQNGRIDFTTSDTGTTFTISLPRAK
jgi:signal transduction histidine kinase/DNA-binding response OmpR family regulator